MATTEVQLSERQPMLTSTEETLQSNPVASTTVTVESSTAVVRKEGDGIPDDKNKFIQIIRPLLVELIGTGLFIFVGMCGVCSGTGLVTSALSFGLILMVFAASFGHISGVHFNPAVTIGILIAGEIQAVMAVIYVVAQLLGGIAAGGLLRLLLATGTYNQCKGGATLLAISNVVNEATANAAASRTTEIVEILQGIMMECIATFVLVTVILMVAVDTKSKTGLAPLLIGFTLAVNILAIGAYTGGSLNPARSLGPAVFAFQWKDHFVYWIGPLVGAIIAGLLYRTVWAHSDRRMFVKRTTAATKA